MYLQVALLVLVLVLEFTSGPPVSLLGLLRVILVLVFGPGLGPALGIGISLGHQRVSLLPEELNHFHLFSLSGLKGVVLLLLVLVLLSDHESKTMTFRQTEQ